MLRVTYTGGDSRQRWLFDPDDVGIDDAEAIERAMGNTSNDTWDSFVQGLMDGKSRPRRALLWYLLRQTNPDYPMPFEDTPKFKMGQLTVELGTDELLKMIVRVQDSPGRSPATREALLNRLYAEHAEAEAAEAEFGAADVTDDPDPKAEPGAGSSGEAGTPPPSVTPPDPYAVAD